MKKKLFLIASSVLLSANCFAQAGEWTWMHGSSSYNPNATYGTQGIPDSLNEPPGVYGPDCWTDHEGNFWLFGGVTNTQDLQSDLWKYDVTANNWTWVKGPGMENQAGVYGTKGIPSVLNNPGARAYGPAAWTDANDNLWLYGGNGYGNTNFNTQMLADMWRYTISTNEWTWMSGSTSDNVHYGLQQIPDTANTPGMREECTANWIDNNNGLWLYGGENYGVSAVFRSDMWRYDVSLNEWEWMSGDTVTSVPASFGTQNVFNVTNTPGARFNYSGWQDASGHFWLFGGYEYNANLFSDLWEYDSSIFQWAWVSGSSVSNNGGAAGNLCDTSAAFYPKSRWENRARWTDECINLWLFGGFGETGILNDLWVYSTLSYDWSWVSGSLLNNQNSVYGTKGVSDPSNVPGARMGAGSWTDNNGNLWLFGGSKDGSYTKVRNDLWRYVPDPYCPVLNACAVAPHSAFQSSDSLLCEKLCTSFFDQSIHNPTSWEWIFPGGTPSTSNDQNPANICYNLPGTYDVTLITTNANGNDTLTLPNYITVYPTPPFPTITQLGYTLTSSPANFYQWQLNSADIPGATNQSYTILQTGYYTVVVGDENGCVNSTTTYVLISGIDEIDDAGIFIYPNPATSILMIEWQNGLEGEEVSIRIYDALGQEVFSSDRIPDADRNMKINLTDLAQGIYFLSMKINDEIVRRKIVITVN
ncbi:MAG TPA: T9SS type A sorting domain-containing protein [Chitinophagales bacterium]|nr:T9SS type A sorting domain-containing protein [Chitinophagales bacterium]